MPEDQASRAPGANIMRDNLYAHSSDRTNKGMTVAVLAAALTASMTLGTSAAMAQAPKTVKFQMDFVPQGMYAGFFYAKAKGYYAAENINVELIDGKGSQLAIEAVANGNVDIVDASSGVAALAIAQGREIVSVGMFLAKSTFGFFVPENSGITSIKQLVGKSVVMTPTAPEALLLPAVFNLVNENYEKDVKRVPVEGAQKLSTYIRGTGDSMVTSLPFGDPIVQPQRKSKTLPWVDVGFVLPDYSFLVSREKLKSDPAMIEGFLRATYRGMAEASKNVDEAIGIYVKERPLLNTEMAKKQWLGYVDYLCSDAGAGKPLGYHAAEDWRIGLETLKQYSGLTGSLEPSRYYTNQFFDGDKSVSKTACGKGTYSASNMVK